MLLCSSVTGNDGHLARVPQASRKRATTRLNFHSPSLLWLLPQWPDWPDPSGHQARGQMGLGHKSWFESRSSAGRAWFSALGDNAAIASRRDNAGAERPSLLSVVVLHVVRGVDILLCFAFVIAEWMATRSGPSCILKDLRLCQCFCRRTQLESVL
jgi:hypothetical protein